MTIDVGVKQDQDYTIYEVERDLEEFDLCLRIFRNGKRVAYARTDLVSEWDEDESGKRKKTVWISRLIVHSEDGRGYYHTLGKEMAALNINRKELEYGLVQAMRKLFHDGRNDKIYFTS